VSPQNGRQKRKAKKEKVPAIPKIPKERKISAGEGAEKRAGQGKVRGEGVDIK